MKVVVHPLVRQLSNLVGLSVQRAARRVWGTLRTLMLTGGKITARHGVGTAVSGSRCAKSRTTCYDNTVIISATEPRGGTMLKGALIIAVLTLAICCGGLAIAYLIGGGE